jgi:hypothetical protein
MPLLRLTFTLFVLLALVLPLAACGGDDVCTEHGAVTVCGDFGEPLYVAQLGGATQWPPVAVEAGRLLVSRGTTLVEIDAKGAVHTLQQVGETLTAPSTDGQGTIFGVSSGANGATVRSWTGLETATPGWTRSLPGTALGSPPSVSDGQVHAAVREGNGHGTLYTIGRQDGAILRVREGSSQAAVVPDGTLRYLTTPNGTDGFAGAPIYASLVAEHPDGSVAWTVAEPQGIVDFAPGPNGDTFYVTGGVHVLKRVTGLGQVAWSFNPPCANCTVAAAPTVSEDVVYFPVWEERQQEFIDPLFALNIADGSQRWVYDGFSSQSNSFSPSKLLNPFGFTQTPVSTTNVKHHPAGRPVMAQDGTLYVSTDGSVAALDKNGYMIGLAMYDATAGEVMLEAHMGDAATSWINPGIRPSPVLGPDGTLYVWDGVAVHAFATGRKAETSAWIAPFGGPDNAGRVPK